MWSEQKVGPSSGHVAQSVASEQSGYVAFAGAVGDAMTDELLLVVDTEIVLELTELEALEADSVDEAEDDDAVEEDSVDDTDVVVSELDVVRLADEVMTLELVVIGAVLEAVIGPTVTFCDG